MTATLPSSFPITSPFVVSGQHLPPRTSTWVCGRQALSAEARTSVVRNRSGRTTDGSRDDRCAPFGIGAVLADIGYDDRPYGCSMCWIRALEGAPRGAGLHHDRLG